MLESMEDTLVNEGLIRRNSIDGDFEGFDDEMLFPLADGTFWIQDEYKYWYFYAFSPRVEIFRQGTQTYLRVEGHAQSVRIRPITEVIHSHIEGVFRGWAGSSTYKLTNGQVWQQTTYKYEYKYAYGPEVLIYESGGGYSMRVDGTVANVRRIH